MLICLVYFYDQKPNVRLYPAACGDWVFDFPQAIRVQQYYINLLTRNLHVVSNKKSRRAHLMMDTKNTKQLP